MLSVSEGRRVSSAILLRHSQSDGSAFNADDGAAEGAYIGAEHAQLAMKATLADQSAQELAKFLTQQTDLNQMVGNPKLQEELWALTGEVRAMMADPFLQEQATLVAEQLEKVMMADPLLQEQAKEVVTQMQAMMTDPRLQGEAERLAQQMEKGMMANGMPRDHAKTLAKRAEAMEAIMTNPILHEPATRLVKQVQEMKANQNFQDQAMRIVQLMETLIADANFQRHARRIAAHMEALRAHVTSQTTDGGPTPDLFSLAEVNRSRSGVSFFPPSLTARMHSKTRGVRSPDPQMAAGKGRNVQPGSSTKRRISLQGVRGNLDVTGNTYVDAPNFQPQFDEVGVLPPLGRWDPLKIREQGPERYRRFVEMEIKHGRLAMAGFLGAITTYAGFRWPGYLSLEKNIKFSDLPGAPLASWAALPSVAWFQIILFISCLELFFLKQDPLKDAGDVVPEGIPWARYPDGYDIFLGDGSIKQVGEEELILGKTWKLNAERNNGRAAMMGMTGLLIHEALTGNPVFPIGES